MKTCDIDGCEKEAVALLFKELDAKRCADCLHFDGMEKEWW